MAEIIRPDDEGLELALKALREGKVIALPTETFYGLAVDPMNEEALKRLYALKRRPWEKPVLLLLGNEEQLFQVVARLPKLAKALMARFWPGPLTLVLPAREGLPRALTGGKGRVAVRLSSHPVPRLLARRYGRPVTGTSANPSGHPPARTAKEVAERLPEVDLILEGEPPQGLSPSTIVEVEEEEVFLLREGEIPWEKILKALEEAGVPLRPEGGRRRKA